MYTYEISKNLERVLFKLIQKNKKQYLAFKKKAKAVTLCDNVDHFKNLRYPLQKYKRVHINKSFVLIFSVDKNKKHIVFEDLEHHDKIYKT